MRTCFGRAPFLFSDHLRCHRIFNLSSPAYASDAASVAISGPERSGWRKNTSADNIDVFTYSARATIGSEALALLAQQQPDMAHHIGEVYYAAPDAVFREFVDDLGAYSQSPSV